MTKWTGFENEGATWEYAYFSANDMVTIAGIPLQLQRAWRSRGQLAGGSGKEAVFTTRDLTKNFIRYQLSLNGVPPSQSDGVSDRVADLIIFFALLSSDGAVEVRGPSKENDRFLACFAHEDSIAYEIAGRPERDSFLFRGDGGELSLVADVQALMEQQRFVANFFIDLTAAALRVAELSARPLISVELSPGSSERRFRRLTGGRLADAE